MEDLPRILEWLGVDLYPRMRSDGAKLIGRRLMTDPDPSALRESLAREEALLAKIETERARAARRVAELRAQLSSAADEAATAVEPVGKAAFPNSPTPTSVLGCRCHARAWLDMHRPVT